MENMPNFHPPGKKEQEEEKTKSEKVIKELIDLI